MTDREPELESDLLDVSWCDLEELLESTESVLISSILRIQEEMAQSAEKSEYYNGFKSAI